jgi:hypothetical protein
LAESAIFYEKPKIFVKNGQKVEVNNLAGNGRLADLFPEIGSPNPGDTF